MMEEGGEEYRVLSPEERSAAADWSNGLPEARVAHIDWAAVRGSVGRPWHSVGGLVAALAELAILFAPGDPRVIVVWATALSPCGETPLPAVRRHAVDVLQTASDTWIICPREGWCIETWREGTVRAG
jgi:hypothetical protein